MHNSKSFIFLSSLNQSANNISDLPQNHRLHQDSTVSAVMTKLGHLYGHLLLISIQHNSNNCAPIHTNRPFSAARNKHKIKCLRSLENFPDIKCYQRKFWSATWKGGFNNKVQTIQWGLKLIWRLKVDTEKRKKKNLKTLTSKNFVLHVQESQIKKIFQSFLYLNF